jgi:hypothetical protein
MSLIRKFFGRPKREASQVQETISWASQVQETISWASDKAVRRVTKRIFAKYEATVRKLAE